MIIWKGNGIIGLILLGLSSYLVEKYQPEYLPSWNYSQLSLTLFLGAILIVPLSVREFRIYLKTKQFGNSIFFIPVALFPVLLFVLGIIFLDYQRQ